MPGRCRAADVAGPVGLKAAGSGGEDAGAPAARHWLKRYGSDGDTSHVHAAATGVARLRPVASAGTWPSSLPQGRSRTLLQRPSYAPSGCPARARARGARSTRFSHGSKHGVYTVTSRFGAARPASRTPAPCLAGRYRSHPGCTARLPPLSPARSHHKRSGPATPPPAPSAESWNPAPGPPGVPLTERCRRQRLAQAGRARKGGCSRPPLPPPLSAYSSRRRLSARRRGPGIVRRGGTRRLMHTAAAGRNATARAGSGQARRGQARDLTARHDHSIIASGSTFHQNK